MNMKKDWRKLYIYIYLGSIDRGILGKSGCVKSLLPKTNNIRKHLIEEQVDFKHLPPPKKKQTDYFLEIFFFLFYEERNFFQRIPIPNPEEENKSFTKTQISI